jgi:hypothetical protein
LAVHDQGTLDFYEAGGLGETFVFTKTFSRPVPAGESEHQAFQLITDTQNRVFAVGLSIGGGFGKNVAVLYHLDLVSWIRDFYQKSAHDPCTWRVRVPKRRSLSRISSAVLVHRNGFGLSLCAAT